MKPVSHGIQELLEVLARVSSNMCVNQTPIPVLPRIVLIGPNIPGPQTNESYWSIFGFGVVPTGV